MGCSSITPLEQRFKKYLGTEFCPVMRLIQRLWLSAPKANDLGGESEEPIVWIEDASHGIIFKPTYASRNKNVPTIQCLRSALAIFWLAQGGVFSVLVERHAESERLIRFVYCILHFADQAIMNSTNATH